MLNFTANPQMWLAARTLDDFNAAFHKINGKNDNKQESHRAYGTAVRIAVEPLIELHLYHSVICICRPVPKMSH